MSAAAFLRLPLHPDHLPGVCANLALLQGHADRLDAVPLPPGLDPAPVFTP